MKKKSKLSTLFVSTLWILIICFIGAIFIDYNLVKSEKDPIFCIKREIVESKNGKTNICTGLGYKFYDTEGEGYISRKFVPIWQKDEDIDNE